MEAQLIQADAAAVLAVQQVDHDEDGGHPLGDGAGDGHALGGHVAANDEEQVQQYVQHAGHGEVDQGTLGVAGGAEDAVAAVVDAHGGQTQGVELQVQHRAGEELLLGVQQAEHGLGEEHADQTGEDTGGQADEQRGVVGVLHVLIAAHAQATGHGHVDAAAQADEQAGEQGDQGGGRAHRAQGDIGVIGVFAGDGHVAEVEQHLQHLGHHQRQAEQQYVFPKRAGGHLYGERPAARGSRHGHTLLMLRIFPVFAE